MSDHRYRPGVEILSVTDTGRRRRWTDVEKVRIVEASLVGGVAETARRHDVGRTLLVRWRRRYREGHLANGPAQPRFMPVTVNLPAAANAHFMPPVSGPLSVDDKSALLEITLVNGRRLSVVAAIDPGVLSRLVRAQDPS